MLWIQYCILNVCIKLLQQHYIHLFEKHGSSMTLAYAGVQTYCEKSFTPYGGSNFDRIQMHNVVGYMFLQIHTHAQAARAFEAY